ncbi:hypothetical protein QYF61_013933 [Mycteria americana]|uniref:G-protein coupled receptors family 1 profile domain-containing protein n=1 Tax=Mycteria americana TaxID=33587 RepID=A0AAN7N1S5_MYCAM|nr:hypothetical protein QYF61_013933 [Mycteria americana]
MSVAVSSAALLSSFMLTTVVYAYIRCTILRTPSVQRHHKAFFTWISFTCMSYISSLTIAYASCTFDDAGPEEKLLCCKLSANLEVPLGDELKFSMGAENETAVTEFILAGFSGLDQRLQLFVSLVLLLLYLTTVMGKATIIFLVCVDHRLQTPMYFFISNLAFLEIWFTSSTSIKLFVILGSGRRTISLSSCFAQSCFYFALGCTELVLFVVMSFDRYVAICQPLRYAAIMKPQLCIHLVIAAWVIGITVLSYCLVLLYKLTFCGSNEIHHFFGDNSPLFNLSCSDTSLLWKIDCFIIMSHTGFPMFHSGIFHGHPFLYSTPASSLWEEKKLLLHVLPISPPWPLHMGAALLSMCTNRIVALLNTVLYPFLNPFIYSLRNKTVILALNEAVARATTQLFP